jgi:hypothetical protein
VDGVREELEGVMRKTRRGQVNTRDKRIRRRIRRLNIEGSGGE